MIETFSKFYPESPGDMAKHDDRETCARGKSDLTEENWMEMRL